MLLFFLLSTCLAAEKNPWTALKSPATGPAESIGSPSAGCIRGAEILKQNTDGVLLMRSERRRMYGHPRLISLLREVGGAFYKGGAAPLFMGDIGMARGGPTMSAHASHQTGIDADIWYTRPKKWNVKASLKQRLHTPIVGMVDVKKRETNKNFGPDQVALLRNFAERDAVDRILVNYAIKRSLCKEHGAEPWIHKIRPWFGHDHHFHLRLKCAASDAKCKPGDPIPDGNGCDKSLDWWWSDEAKAEAQKNQHKQDHPVMPELPPECADVLKSS